MDDVHPRGQGLRAKSPPLVKCGACSLELGQIPPTGRGTGSSNHIDVRLSGQLRLREKPPAGRTLPRSAPRMSNAHVA